ncbi:MAG: ABC transporter ATP-binding protein [Candidatus Delongbacteria bacterium]|nr:ABC transporter ATP-binding protein [Candidatus Delongbacteria bacterium]
MWWNDYPDDFSDESTSLPTREMLRRVLPYIRPYKKIFIVSFFLALLGVVLVLLQPVILRHIIDHDIPSGQFRNLARSGLFFLGVMAITSVTGFFSSWLLQKAGVRAVNDIKLEVFGHLLSLGLPYLEKQPVGRLVSRIESDTQRLISLTSIMMQRLLMSGGMLIGALVVLALIDRRLFLIAAAILPLIVLGTFLLFKYLRPYFREERVRYAEVSSSVAEFIPAVPLLQLFNRLRWARQRLQEQNRKYAVFTIRLSFREYGIFRGLSFLEVLVTVIALYLGAGWVAAGTLTVGSLVLFSQYIAQIYWPIIMLSDQLAEIQRAGGAADRIFAALDMKPTVPEPASPQPLPERVETITFEDVTFSYVPDQPVLRNVSLQVQAGETIALVGPTGGGKTTITSLLCRLRDPDSGRILLNGIDIREFDTVAYRQLFGLVLQDLYLFPASVQDNLSAFRADVTGKAVERAAQLVGMDAVLRNRTDGYDSILAERGKDLSYGQRQLLAFARALAIDPSVLVLDEATSSVDPGTEKRIQLALDALLENRTGFIVAHRLSTIQHADRILVIGNGVILEEGTHAELMQLGEQYYEMVVTQDGVITPPAEEPEGGLS